MTIDAATNDKVNETISIMMLSSAVRMVTRAETHNASLGSPSDAGMALAEAMAGRLTRPQLRQLVKLLAVALDAPL